MNAVFYLYRRTFANRLKKALHKPITYFYIALIVLYIFMIPYSFKLMFASMGLDTPEGMVALFTIFAFWVIPANLIAYAKRKGLLFRGSDVHFLFPSPVTPKKILLYAHVKTLLTTLVFSIALTFLGMYIFRIVWWKMLLYFAFSVVLENLLEGSIMLLLYGSERLHEKSRKLATAGAYLLVGVLVLMGIYTYIVKGLSLESVLWFLHSDMIQFVPIIGWYVAVVHLLFIGPTVVNLICSALYLLMIMIALYAALRMKCTGEYFEDAIKFAEDYEEILSSKRQGRMDVRFGKKKKFGKASVTYKGGFAKALFYRQLLEYKKNKFFIFDSYTLVSLIAGVGIAWLYLSKKSFGSMGDFVLPGAISYVVLIFTAYSGKWGKELNSPYTFMIPDSPFRKLWYATLMQHIQAAINGCLFVLPGAFVMGMKPITTVLCIIFFIVLNAGKLYIVVVSRVLVGNLLGRTGQQLFQMFLQGLAIAIPILGAVLGFMLGGLDGAYLLMDLLLLAETVGLMVWAALGFNRMETGE